MRLPSRARFESNRTIRQGGRMTTTRVALLGTGIMGSGMARNIVKAGRPLTVWNRTRDKAEGLGTTVADTPREAVAEATILVTILADADTNRQAVREAE